MTLDDFKHLATGSVLFSLDRIIAPRLVNIFYLLGLAALALWAISHLFATFSFGFGSGLWGLLEIVVFGLLGFVVLRIVCETLIVFFKANERAAKSATQTSSSSSTLIDEVRDAIEELAERDEESDSDAAALPAGSSATGSAKPSSSSSKSSSGKASSAKSSGSRSQAAGKSGSSKSGSGTAKSGTSSSRPRRTARRTPPPKESGSDTTS